MWTTSGNQENGSSGLLCVLFFSVSFFGLKRFSCTGVILYTDTWDVSAACYRDTGDLWPFLEESKRKWRKIYDGICMQGIPFFLLLHVLSFFVFVVCILFFIFKVFLSFYLLFVFSFYLCHPPLLFLHNRWTRGNVFFFFLLLPSSLITPSHCFSFSLSLVVSLACQTSLFSSACAFLLLCKTVWFTHETPCFPLFLPPFPRNLLLYPSFTLMLFSYFCFFFLSLLPLLSFLIFVFP